MEGTPKKEQDQEEVQTQDQGLEEEEEEKSGARSDEENVEDKVTAPSSNEESKETEEPKENTEAKATNSNGNDNDTANAGDSKGAEGGAATNEEKETEEDEPTQDCHIDQAVPPPPTPFKATSSSSTSEEAKEEIEADEGESGTADLTPTNTDVATTLASPAQQKQQKQSSRKSAPPSSETGSSSFLTPPKKDKSTAKTNKAYDFAPIENVPTQDTMPIVGSTSLDSPISQEEDEQQGLLSPVTTASTVASTPPSGKKIKSSSDDGDSVSSDDTAVLQEKRKQERRCGLYICGLGVIGVLVAVVLLLIGFLSGKHKAEDSATSVPTTTMVPTTSPVTTLAPASPTAATPTSFPTIQITLTPTMTTLFPLPPVTVQAIESDADSPQALAYEWLLQQPDVDLMEETRLRNRYALAVLYFATNGEQWTSSTASNSNNKATNTATTIMIQASPSSYLTYDTHECDWMMPFLTRNETCNAQDEVTAIVLPNNNLFGVLPPEPFLLLPELQRFELGNNLLYATIPTYLGSANKLQTLDLSINEITGSIPSEIGNCTSLTSLQMALNLNLKGSLPTTMGQLSQLEDLMVFATSLEGSIVSELGNLYNLKRLYLQDNKLSGSIPHEIFTGATLQHDFDNNPEDATDVQRQQDIVSSSSSPSGMSLREVRLDSNKLSGSIPERIADLPSLQDSLLSLVLSDNSLTGELPSALGLLRFLQELRVDGNAITGKAPVELFHASSMLRKLYLNKNPGLSGQIVNEESQDGNGLALALLADLQELSIIDTNMTGVLPDTVCGIQVLAFNCSERLCGCDCVCPTAAITESPTDTPTRSPTRTPTSAPIAATLSPTMQATIDMTTMPTMGDTTILDLEETDIPITLAPTEGPPSSTTDGPTLSPTASTMVPTHEPPEVFVLPNYTMAAIRQSAASPQAKALLWLEEDPNYESYSVFRLYQRFALATLAYATTSSIMPWFHAENWLSYDAHECDWYANDMSLKVLSLQEPCETRVTVKMQSKGPKPKVANDREYVAILLPFNGMQGTLPPELALLPELRVIDLSGNLLYRSIPATLGMGLVELEELTLSQNYIEGTIPESLFQMTNLKKLMLFGNRLTGRVLPSDVGQLQDQLTTLGLSSNQLTGALPSQLGLLTNLVRLWLDDNRLEGIPTELGFCTALKTFKAATNRLAGKIVFVWSVFFFLSFCFPSTHPSPPWSISGSIPESIGGMTSLELLDLSENGTHRCEK